MPPLSLLHFLTPPVSTPFCSSPAAQSLAPTSLSFQCYLIPAKKKPICSLQLKQFPANIPPTGPSLSHLLVILPFHSLFIFALIISFFPVLFSSLNFAIHIMYHIVSSVYFITTARVYQVLTMARNLTHITTYCTSSKG